MISEKLIDQVLHLYNTDEERYVDDLAQLMDVDPALLAYLNQESNEVLTEEEKDILWFIILVIYQSILSSELSAKAIDPEVLTACEEENWALLADQKSGSFRDRVTPFFDQYIEEDLLAFVEDAVEPDEESPMSTVGREVIFVAAKSIIDYQLVKS